MSNILVTKRNGQKEPLNIEKIHKVVFEACAGISGVAPSEVEIRSQIQFYNNIKTSDIQETLIKAAADLISEEAPNYQYVAGRLINYHLRKEVYGQFEPWHLYKLVERNVALGFYDPELMNWYSKEEWHTINGFVKHSRDETLTYAAMEQFRGKYLVQNRYTKEILETPQVCYILIAATLFAQYPKETRLKWVKDYYDAISEHWVSLPTPVMSGVRTPQKQFSSCVLIETDDSLDSINATTSAIVRYVSQKAGIGIGAGKIRAIGSPIRNGDATHTGVIPFYKMFQAAVRSCSQGGVRNGAATLYYPIWHLEIEDLLVLKNNKGTEDNRIRHMDYGVQFSKLFYERLIQDRDITLFSPNDVPGLYEAFFADQDKFKTLYENAEKSPKIRKKTIKARDLFTAFMQERKDTGRIYLMNVDHANTHSSYIESLAPVRMSNLCAEITLPTKPLNDLNDEEGRIALCTLSAINWGKIQRPEDFEEPCRLAVRGLDALLDYQKYPVRAAQKHTEDYRPLGVGVINFAYWLAKNDLSYSNPDALVKTDEFAEAWSYYLIAASLELAKEKGAAKKIEHSKYARGIVPIDTRKREVDELVPYQERMPWQSLREELKQYGIRNTTLMAIMPSECQSLNNELLLENGEKITLDRLIKELGNIDIDLVHEKQMIGQRFEFLKPILLYNNIKAYECYYNGPQWVDEIEFEDGSKYRFTKNHKLLVIRDNIKQWVEVNNLMEGDDIVSVGLSRIKMKIKKINRNVAIEQTWDISTNSEVYHLGNGVISHNTSAQIANATNGVEPPRSYVSIKQSKHGVLKQVVPEFRRLKNKYELLWNQKSPEGYLKLMAVLQKYIDQSISTNTSYNPEFYDDEKIPMSELLKHLLLCYRYGIKTLYYFNQYDGQGEIEVDKLVLKNSDNEKSEEIIDKHSSSEDSNDCDSCVL